MTTQRTSALEEGIERIEAEMRRGFDKVDARFERIDARFERMETTINDLRRDSKSDFKWIIGVTMTMWATTMAAVLAALFR